MVHKCELKSKLNEFNYFTAYIRDIFQNVLCNYENK